MPLFEFKDDAGIVLIDGGEEDETDLSSREEADGNNEDENETGKNGITP